MKTIQLQKSTIDLPDSWEDLSFREKLFTFEILSQLFSNAISPEIARLKMLIEYTGYKPSTTLIIRESEEREIINFNLLKLSEELTFAFSLEENRIIPDYSFKTNPIPYIKIGECRYYGKRFELDITAKTDVTAREFADCFDLLSAQRNMESDSDREECVNQICAILYPMLENYNLNLVSDHHKSMQSIHPAIKFGIIYWFTGIVKFYTEHPVYEVLFKRNGVPDDDNLKIRLGMNEIILSLQKEGYGSPETMNLNDYFDAQVKYLKDKINNALSKGAKIEDINQQTGIPLSTIIKLT
jgi:hypothetical protein